MPSFLRQFILHPKETGAVAPSSDTLAELITDAAELANAKCVVELGSGTGVFTEKILKKIPANCVFFAIEKNPIFVEATKKRCPNAKVYKDSADSINKYLIENGAENCQAIVCGLPWSILDVKTQDDIMAAVMTALSPGGRFVTFAYLQGLLLPSGRAFSRLLKKNFSSVKKTRTVWNNFPPAFVYICQK